MATRADDIAPLNTPSQAGHLDNPNPEPAAEPKASPAQERIAEMRAALERGEDALAAGAALQARAQGQEPEEEVEEQEDAPAAVETDTVETAAEAETAEAEQEVEEEVEEEAEPIVVSLPARQPGAEPFDIEVADEETAERLRQAINDGMRRDEFKKQMAALDSERAELRLIGDELESDPVSFMAERVSPALRLDVARYLIANATAEEFEQLREAISGFEDDPRERELAALRQERERRTKKEERIRTARAETEKQQAAAVVVQAIEGLIPEDMDSKTGDRFYRLAVEEIQEYARTHRLSALEAERVPVILEKAGILRMFGVKQQPAGQKRTATPPTVEPKGSAVAPTDAKAKAEAGAARVQKRVAARRASTAVAPTGTGAAPSRAVQVPRGQTGKERLAYLREHPELLKRS